MKYIKLITILSLLLTGGLSLYFKNVLVSKPEPYTWNVGIVAPYQLPAQVLYMYYQNVEGKSYVTNKFFLGTASGGYAHIDHWERVVWSGNSNRSPLIGLPKSISLCWYSNVESQLYGTEIELLPAVQTLMSEKIYMKNSIDHENTSPPQYRNRLMLGLAPGGVVNAWLNTPDKIDYPSIWVAEGKTMRAEETDWCKGVPERTTPLPTTEALKIQKKFPYGHWQPNEPNPLPHSKFFVVKDKNTGKPIAHINYRITTDDGRILEGATNMQGETREVFAESEDAIHFELLEDNPTKN